MLVRCTHFFNWWKTAVVASLVSVVPDVGEHLAQPRVLQDLHGNPDEVEGTAHNREGERHPPVEEEVGSLARFFLGARHNIECHTNIIKTHSITNLNSSLNSINH